MMRVWSHRVCVARCLGVLVSLVLVRAVPAQASATGLNNIPTADVVGEQQLVLQQWSDYGPNQRPEHFVGFKYGPIEHLEVGLDAKVGSTALTRGPVKFQAKYQVELTDELAVAAGFADLSGDSKRTGKIFPYLVASGDLGWFRAHLGFDAQDKAEGPFAGVDRSITCPWWNRTTTFRADILTTSEQRDVLWSAGLIQELTDHVLMETWYSASSDPARDESVIVKFDVVWQF